MPRDFKKYQKHYSEERLLNKISKTFKKAGIKVIYHVLLLYYVLMDANTPFQHKMMIIGALGYFILPVDLIPDPILGLGFTDDAAALITCLKKVSDNVTPSIKKKAISKLHDWFDKAKHDSIALN